MHTFRATIHPTRKRKLHDEFYDIIGGLTGDEWQANLRRRPGESLEDAAVRHVRREFEKACKTSGFDLDPKPFKIAVEVE